MENNKTKDKGIKLKHILAIVLVIIVMSASFYLYYMIKPVGSSDDWDLIQMRYTRENDIWIVNLTNVHQAWDEEDKGFNYSEIKVFFNGNESYLHDIDSVFNGTLLFNDNDSNGHMSTGDEFIIPDYDKKYYGSELQLFSLTGYNRYTVTFR